jgi:hypothetical protein
MKLDNAFDPGVKRIICGAALQRALAARSYSSTALALVGYCLQTGVYAITCTTPKQTGPLVGVPMALLRTVRQAKVDEYMALRSGAMTVEALHKEHLNNRRPTDADIDEFIAQAGANRVLDGLDRATRPNKEPAANGHANDNAAVVGPVQLSL